MILQLRSECGAQAALLKSLKKDAENYNAIQRLGIKKLISLVHPYKHQGSRHAEYATRVTQELLKLLRD